MTRASLDWEFVGTSLDAKRLRRVAETLGVAPRAKLSALVEYGLSDSEIALYHKLPAEIVAELRDHWGLAPNG